MRTIDGVRYISATEYQELFGVSAGTVTNRKKSGELPFEVFDDLKVELINYDLLKLSEKEQALSQLKFSTTKPLWSFDYKQLGLFFGQLIQDSTSKRENAETLLAEQSEELAQWQDKATQLQEALSAKTEEAETLTTRNESFAKELETAIATIAQHEAANSELLAAKSAAESELQTLRTQLASHQQFDKLVEAVVAKLSESKPKSKGDETV